jgi:methylmalonyl-CoA mutase N-terminal domain/subunit
VTGTIDPLGGSPFIEELTDRLEQEARELIAEIDSRGGALAAVEQGYQQGQIHRAAYEYQRELEAGTVRVVGVNCHAVEGETPPAALKLDPGLDERRATELADWRAARDDAALQAAMDALESAARDETVNLMPSLLVAVEAGATVGEICTRLDGLFGRYTSPSLL